MEKDGWNQNKINAADLGIINEAGPG
jgi:hypothetical protein